MPLLDRTPTKINDYSRVKRGGGPPPSDTTYASGPPTSTFHKGQAPTIDGSEGGFIGLIVGLGLLFIGSSVGIWVLLKRRNEKGRRPIPFLSNLLGGRSTKDGSGGFGRLSSTDRRGFVRTNSPPGDGDDGTYSDEEGRGKSSSRRSNGVKLTKARERSPAVGSETNIGAEREGLYSNDSNPFTSPSVVRLQEQAGPYGDAFSARPSTDSLDEAVHSSTSHYGGGVQLQDRQVVRKDSDGSSPVSPSSFDRGTKFREAL
ncbi:hypothetical protein FRB96_005207 [Tulasnella sp. 330]|nr:hypothetical protein FRB96_005207 [Tulasnella sp. 330]KAG8884871.1 hypothetical protein FRB97_003078 [Tulasnella sp. 331]KAG8890129.1 hypothetical protein FRB98_000857 [Tulasnella sp. 332]